MKNKFEAFPSHGNNCVLCYFTFIDHFDVYKLEVLHNSNAAFCLHMKSVSHSVSYFKCLPMLSACPNSTPLAVPASAPVPSEDLLGSSMTDCVLSFLSHCVLPLLSYPIYEFGECSSWEIFYICLQS